MTQPSTLRAAPYRAATAIVLLVTFACSKSEKPVGDGSAKTVSAAPAATSVAPDSAARLASAAQMRPQPGNLPKPIDEMTGDELFSFTRTLSFGGGHERRRRCRGNAQCRGRQPKDSTLIRVDAVEREDSLGTSGLSPNGVIGVRALNRGTMPDSVYNTRPGKEFEYYLVILPAGPGVANWRLEELTTTQGARSHRSVASGSFHSCNHTFTRGARADFKTCAQATPTTPAALGKIETSDGESPIWVGCEFGCCTADTPNARG